MKNYLTECLKKSSNNFLILGKNSFSSGDKFDSTNLGKPNDRFATISFDEKTAQHKHQHSVASASCPQSGQS